MSRSPLSTLLCLILLVCHAYAVITPYTPSAHIIAVNGTDHFASLIASHTHTFVNFFDPNCPHCIALAPNFAELADAIHAHNAQPATPPAHRIVIAEADYSRLVNKKLVQAHAEAFPTLKLFRAGRCLSQYEGVRRLHPMLHFLMSAVSFHTAHLVDHLDSRPHLHAFLQNAASRPVVISVFHHHFQHRSLYPAHIKPCASCWHSAILLMRNASAPNVAFATVSDPTLLIPTERHALDRFSRMRRVPYSPALVAAPSGKSFWMRASWWYPGLHDDESMEAFMHVNTLTENQYGVVDSLNSHHLLTSTRPLVLVFGEEHKPSWEDAALLQEAARFSIEPRLVPLYLRTKDFQWFGEHAGVLGEGALNETEGLSAYLLYRTAASRPYVSRYVHATGKEPSEWLGEIAREVNRSNVAMPPGKVLELNRDIWDHVFEFDGRGVLLELYRSDCNACHRFAPTFEKAAKMLIPQSGAIVVAKFDLGSHFLPEKPSLPAFKYVPSIVYIPSGRPGILFDGWNAPRAIAQFAREQGSVEDVPLASLGIADICGGLLFQAGLILCAFGVLIQRHRSVKTDHIT